MKTAFTSFFLLFAFPFAHAQQSTDQKCPFAIEISVIGDSLHKEVVSPGGDFWIQAKITNISGENQTITVWTQTGWSWLSSSPLIHPEVSAQQNVSGTRMLRPGDVYSENVGVKFYPRDQKSVTFRLGFFPKAKLPISPKPDAIPRDQITWSNAVTLTR